MTFTLGDRAGCLRRRYLCQDEIYAIILPYLTNTVWKGRIAKLYFTLGGHRLLSLFRSDKTKALTLIFCYLFILAKIPRGSTRGLAPSPVAQRKARGETR